MWIFPPINKVKLSSVQKDSCEGQITEELLDASKAFKAGKTPGLDGIPVEVYKTFFERLGLLFACFYHSYINGRLSDTQPGLISLLLKQDPSGVYI